MESLRMKLVPVFDWLLRTTLQAALLLCLILVIQLVLRGRLPIRWRYYLWLLLLIHMAAPWSLHRPLPANPKTTDEPLSIS